jgi:hypothetical protein
MGTDYGLNMFTAKLDKYFVRMKLSGKPTLSSLER